MIHVRHTNPAHTLHETVPDALGLGTVNKTSDAIDGEEIATLAHNPPMTVDEEHQLLNPVLLCKHCGKPIERVQLIGFSLICPECGKPQNGISEQEKTLNANKLIR